LSRPESAEYCETVAGGIYLRQGDRLVAMNEEPYATEEILQTLLEQYPELLAGDRPGIERTASGYR
jgi:hypothetical protein